MKRVEASEDFDLEAAVRTLLDVVPQLKRRVSALELRVTAIASSREILPAMLDRIDALIDELDAEMEEYDQAFDGLEEVARALLGHGGEEGGVASDG